MCEKLPEKESELLFLESQLITVVLKAFFIVNVLYLEHADGIVATANQDNVAN